MGFNLPWFGKKQDNAQAVPPAAAAPNDTLLAADVSVPPVASVSPDTTTDAASSEAGDAPAVTPVEQATPEVVAQPDSTLSPDIPAPTSPAADLMGQTTPETSDVVAPEAQSITEPVEPAPTFDAAPTPEASAQDASPQGDAPVPGTPEQPEETPKTQL